LPFDELPEHVLERQERVRSLFRGETPLRPVAYLCPLGYARNKTNDLFDEGRALNDLEYLADFQTTGVAGLLEEDNDNTPFVWARAGGVHFIDSLFGIRPVVRRSGIWGNPLDWDLEGGTLPEFDATGGFVPRALEEIAFLRQRFGVLPITPPDLSGPLNGALNVFDNQRLLRLACRDPGAARRAVERVARAIVEVNQIFSAAIGQNIVHTDRKSWVPPEYILLPWCACQLVSRETYEKVVRRADEMVLGEFSGGLFHICGRTTHLIPTLREMKLVRGVELQGSAGTYDCARDYPAYFEGLRDDQVIIVMVGGISPHEVMDVSGGERTILRFTDAEALRRFRCGLR